MMFGATLTLIVAMIALAALALFIPRRRNFDVGAVSQEWLTTHSVERH